MSTTAPELDTRPIVTGYDPEIRFYASRYTQGGRTAYSLDLSLAQIAGLLPAPDPMDPQPGNRRIVPAHATAFGNYVREHDNWFSPGISLRATRPFQFDTMEQVGGTEIGVLSLPFMALTGIHILDGQHRILGIHTALRQITADIDKTRGLLTRLDKRPVPEAEVAEKERNLANLQARIDELVEQRRRFEAERIQVQIVIENDQTAYQQMFYDTADNQLPLKASVKVRFDARKAVNRVLQDALDHPLLSGRVDLEADQLGRQNPNLLSAKHVADIIRILTVGISGRIGKRIEANLDEAEVLNRTVSFLDLLSTLEPFDRLVGGEVTAPDLRNKAMIGSPVMLRVLAGTYRELILDGMAQDKIDGFFSDLTPHLDKPADPAWVSHTGDLFFPGALSPNSRRQDLVELTNLLVTWTHNPPAWL